MIEKLNVLEHIRKRPAMYIGSIDHYGYSELISYLIEDFIEADIYEISFLLQSNNQLIIEGCTDNSLLLFIDALENLDHNRDGKFCLSLVTIVALSEYVSIKINDRDALRCKKGNCEILKEVKDHTFNRIKIEFVPDTEIFKDLFLNYESLNNLLRRFSFLNNQIKIKSIDESKHEKQINIFHYKNGLAEIVDYELEKRFLYNLPVFKLNFEKKTTFSYSLAVAFMDNYWIEPKTKVYANYKETILGGSLLDGILQGFKKFLRDESLKRNFKLSVGNAKLRKYLFLYASVKGKLTYSGSTKWRLETPKVKTEIKEFVYQELRLYFKDKDHKVSEILEILQEKI